MQTLLKYWGEMFESVPCVPRDDNKSAIRVRDLLTYLVLIVYTSPDWCSRLCVKDSYVTYYLFSSTVCAFCS
jgi:hypothetical protein